MSVTAPKREIADVSEAQSLVEHVIRASSAKFSYTPMVDVPTVGNPENVFPGDLPTGVLIYRIEWPENWITTGEFPRGMPIYCFAIVQTEPVTQPTASSELLPREILDRLNYLAGLPENWDSEGASAVTEFTINRIKGLLRRAYSAAGDRLTIPFISPAHDGMLVIEWKGPTGKELILDVPSDETFPGFLLVELRPTGDEVETDAEIGDEWPIEKVIYQLLAS